MATRSDWLSAVGSGLWAHDVLRFVPDVVLPEPPDRPAARGEGPRVAFCGFPSEFSLVFLLALLELDVQPVGIITSPGAHPAILGVNALSQIADHIGVPLLRLWRVNDEHSRLEISALRADAVVMASFDQIVGARALALPVNGWLNVHPSALPEYRGPEPVYWTIADGAPRAGITLHRAAPRFDAGPVLAQRTLEVAGDDTAGTLTRRLSKLGVAALEEALTRQLAGDRGDPLDLSRGSYRPSIGHRRLDQAPDVHAAERMVRAGEPNMPAWTTLDSAPAYVHRARVSQSCDGPCVSFSDGCLELLDTSVICGCHHDTAECPHLEGF